MYFDELEWDGEVIIDFVNINLQDVDIRYWSIMYLEKMINLSELSLNLRNNLIKNEGLSEIILWINSLDNLTSLNLEM